MFRHAVNVRRHYTLAPVRGHNGAFRDGGGAAQAGWRRTTSWVVEPWTSIRLCIQSTSMHGLELHRIRSIIATALPHPLLFTSVIGAHLDGLALPDSDVDLRGC